MVRNVVKLSLHVYPSVRPSVHSLCRVMCSVGGGQLQNKPCPSFPRWQAMHQTDDLLGLGSGQRPRREGESSAWPQGIATILPGSSNRYRKLQTEQIVYEPELGVHMGHRGQGQTVFLLPEGS